MSAFDRVPVERALAWVDAATTPLEGEEIALETAAGRVLAAELRSLGAIPPMDCAATDGYAVRAAESLGAGAYNPLTLTATAVEAGEALPSAADAVVPFHQAEPDGASRVVLVEPVAAGANVDQAGATAAADTLLVPAGTRREPV